MLPLVTDTQTYRGFESLPLRHPPRKLLENSGLLESQGVSGPTVGTHGRHTCGSNVYGETRIAASSRSGRGSPNGLSISSANARSNSRSARPQARAYPLPRGISEDRACVVGHRRVDHRQRGPRSRAPAVQVRVRPGAGRRGRGGRRSCAGASFEGGSFYLRSDRTRRGRQGSGAAAPPLQILRQGSPAPAGHRQAVVAGRRPADRASSVTTTPRRSRAPTSSPGRTRCSKAA